MTEGEEALWREKHLRANFEAELPHRMRRASRVRLQHFIPAHWFATAASDCAGMYIAGFFYGAVSALNAALAILSDRNDFHHLNKDVEQDWTKLEALAEDCINQLHMIESEIFAYSFGEKGEVVVQKSDYWPSNEPGSVQVNLRQLW